MRVRERGVAKRKVGELETKPEKKKDLIKISVEKWKLGKKKLRKLAPIWEK